MPVRFSSSQATHNVAIHRFFGVRGILRAPVCWRMHVGLLCRPLDAVVKQKVDASEIKAIDKSHAVLQWCRFIGVRVLLCASHMHAVLLCSHVGCSYWCRLVTLS